MDLLHFDDDTHSLYERGYSEFKNCFECGGDIDYLGYGIYKCSICGKAHNN